MTTMAQTLTTAFAKAGSAVRLILPGAALVGALLAVGTVPVQAQGLDGLTVMQPMPCEFSSDLGRFLSVEEIETPQAVHVTQTLIPDVLRGGLAYFEVDDLRGSKDGSHWLVLQHCPTSQDLLVQVDGNGEAVRSRLWDLLAAVEDYTMSEAAEILAGLGATTEVTDAQLGTCACEHQRFYYGIGN